MDTSLARPKAASAMPDCFLHSCSKLAKSSCNFGKSERWKCNFFSCQFSLHCEIAHQQSISRHNLSVTIEDKVIIIGGLGNMILSHRHRNINILLLYDLGILGPRMKDKERARNSFSIHSYK